MNTYWCLQKSREVERLNKNYAWKEKEVEEFQLFASSAIWWQNDGYVILHSDAIGCLWNDIQSLIIAKNVQ